MTDEPSNKMEKEKRCCGTTLKTLEWIWDTVFSLTLRQGVIIVGIHHITLGMFVILVLLLGITHAGEMQGLLRHDMEDDLERQGLDLEDHPVTNNQKRFQTANALSNWTMTLLYSATIYVILYLAFCISLVHGAVHRRHDYVAAWIFAAFITLIVGALGSVAGVENQFIHHVFGSSGAYYLFVALTLISFLYSIACACAFIHELNLLEKESIAGFYVQGLDKGERLVLLDETAHSNVLSSVELKKLTRKDSFQFV